MALAISADPQRFETAIQWFATRTVMTAGDADGLSARSLSHGFWVGAGLQLLQVQRVFDEIDSSIQKSESFESFRDRVRDVLKNPHHAEVVFRNATQRAYNAARWIEMQDPSVKQVRPFWMYDSILDSRTTTICRDRNKTILGADDPWWDTNTPPLHHACRASIRNLRRKETERRGGVSTIPTDSHPMEGFGASPRQDDSGVRHKKPKPRPRPVKPKQEKVDPTLHRELERKERDDPKVKIEKLAHKAKSWVTDYAHYGNAASTVAWGRAALETGLDMTVVEAMQSLEPYRSQVPAINALLSSISRSTDPARRSENHRTHVSAQHRLLALYAGHKRQLRSTKSLAHPSVPGHRGLAFLSEFGAASLRHPTDWTVSARGGRVFCDIDRKTIYHRNDDPPVFVHEWMHAVEVLNDSRLESSRAFLASRTRDDSKPKNRLRKLKDIQPHKPYRNNEVAREDEFVDPYLGKDYSEIGRYDNAYATEATSMSAELLFAGYRDWGNLLDQMDHDPEWLFWAFGQLANQ